MEKLHVDLSFCPPGLFICGEDKRKQTSDGMQADYEERFMMLDFVGGRGKKRRCGAVPATFS